MGLLPLETRATCPKGSSSAVSMTRPAHAEDWFIVALLTEEEFKYNEVFRLHVLP